ncbi:hypothetical protein E2C01_027472 [Portunus trituberculatus]|uniref:Uncharacterized protein n=1 Tax=Portunus trituberculatus TaxID=210409 RepID=A0A5B7ENT3_PORTR|nr:hypothetical protein [Portunus trituberculatus]
MSCCSGSAALLCSLCQRQERSSLREAQEEKQQKFYGTFTVTHWFLITDGLIHQGGRLYCVRQQDT